MNNRRGWYTQFENLLYPYNIFKLTITKHTHYDLTNICVYTGDINIQTPI